MIKENCNQFWIVGLLFKLYLYQALPILLKFFLLCLNKSGRPKQGLWLKLPIFFVEINIKHDQQIKIVK